MFMCLLEERRIREKKEEDEEKEKELAGGVGDKEGGGERREKEETDTFHTGKLQEFPSGGKTYRLICYTVPPRGGLRLNTLSGFPPKHVFESII